jgi:micrococcal nuclease
MIGTLLVCASLIAVDGDTIKCDGVNLRDMGDGAPFVSSYDAPEIWSRKCLAELDLARKAKDRMSELLRTPGLRIIDSGQRDDTRNPRPLV